MQLVIIDIVAAQRSKPKNIRVGHKGTVATVTETL